MSTIKINSRKNIFILLFFFFFLGANAQTVSTLAGSGTNGFANGTGTTAQFSYPYGVALDAAGNIYVADRSNNRIRKITTNGVVTTLAGSGIAGFANGTGTAAQFNLPIGVATDALGNVYVTDMANNRIRKITATGVVTTLAGSSIAGSADGTGASAQFANPGGIAVDVAGTVYVADSSTNRIRKITAAGVVSTLAGSTPGYADGTGTSAQFLYPCGVALDAVGNIFIEDSGNNRIRKITAAGVVSTLAGSTSGYSDGTGTAAQFYVPCGVAADAAGNVYVAENGNNRVRKITAAGVVTTLAGSGAQGFTDGEGTAAQFYWPYGVTIDAVGNIFIGDSGNHRIRKISGVLGTASYSHNQISVYPIPTTSIINIDLEDITVTKTIIFDLNGRVVQSENIVDNRSNLNINHLANGIYLMQIITDKGMITKKIVKN